MKEKEKKHKRRGRGEGTVYQRKDGRWVAELTLEDGKRKPLYGKTQEEVIAKLKQAEYEKRQGILATGPKQKLGDYLIYWLDEVHKRRIGSNTYQRYQEVRDKHIIPHLGQIQLRGLTTRKIQQFFNLKADEGLSASYLLQIRTVLFGTLRQAVKERLIGVNPCQDISLPSRKKRKAQILTLEQARHLLEQARGTTWESFIALALAMGIRHGELLALHWEEINFETRTIHIQYTITRDENRRYIVGDRPKSDAGDRVLLMPQPVCEILKAHRVRQHEERLKAGPLWQDLHFVFCTKDGKMLKPGLARSISTAFLSGSVCPVYGFTT